MIIYADEFLLKNILMTYLILSIVGEMIYSNYKKRRLLLGSLLSSVITLFSIIYEMDDSLITKIITLSMMVLISFSPQEHKVFLIEIVFICLITFLIGGIMNSSINNSFEVIVFGIISVIALKKYNDYYKKKKWKTRNLYKLKFKIENDEIELNAFLDTGNFLTTDFKNESVIIITKEALKNKISNKIYNLLENGEIENLNFNTLKNIRSINYSVLNEKIKTMYGLKINNIRIQSENMKIIRNAVIALSKNKIKESDAIIGMSLLEGGMEIGDTFYAKAKSQEIIC